MYRIWAQKYGRVFRYFGQANCPRVVVADPKFVEQILSNSDSEPRPLLRSEQYESLVPSIVKPIQQLADQWRLYCSTEIVVSHGLRLVALEIFAQTVLGDSLNSIHDTHRHAFNRAFLAAAQQQNDQNNPTLWDLSRRFLSRAPRKTTLLEQETLALVASASQRLDSTSPALLAHWMQKPATLKDLQHQAMNALTEV
jgi:cytochrome P450